VSLTETIIPGIKKITPEQEKGSAWEPPNIYLVGADQLTLIDAGYDRETDVRFILDAVGEARLERIVLTHGHIDHAGGAWAAREATGAEVCAHPADASNIERRFPGNKVDRLVEEGEKLNAGSFTLEVIHTPGHAPGHIALYIESEGVLFPGDLVTGEGSTLVAPPEGNIKAYMESLRRVRKMPMKMLLPGHGPVREDPDIRIAELIEHRELREICIYKCLADAEVPLNLKALVKVMYLGLIHPALEMAAAGTAWAHLEKMIEDGNVTAGPEGEQNPFAKTFSLTEGVVEQVLNLFK
jgi:glyoxylase-like metal-dependent hydrolase (beta-lactamase superfamily II)